MKHDIFRIAAYTRISVDTELNAENISIENQKAIIQRFIDERFPGADVDYYEDRDKSGYTFEQRPGYQKMRVALFAGVYNIMIVKDFSRFSRRNGLGLDELEKLRDVGVRIISIFDNVDYPTKEDWMTIQFRFLMNEVPVTETSKKVRNIIDMRQEKGEWICSAPYGYYLHPTKKKVILIDEEGADVVRLIFRLYNEGLGYKKIARYLTEKGYPTGTALNKKHIEEKGVDVSHIKVNNVWNTSTVAEIVKNDYYIGTLRQRMYSRPGINKHDKKLPKEENIVFENHHEPIIDMETFKKAQERLSHNNKTHYRGVRKYQNPYTGKIFCADCGSPMFSTSNPNRPDGYVCGKYHRLGLSGCTSHHIHRTRINDEVKSFIRDVRDSLKNEISDYSATGTKRRGEDNKLRVEQLKTDVEGYKKRLVDIARMKLEETFANPENKEIIAETYKSLEDEFRDRLNLANEQIAFLEEDSEKRKEIKKNIKDILETFDKILKKKEFSGEDISLIIDKITVSEDKIVTLYLKNSIAELENIVRG